MPKPTGALRKGEPLGYRGGTTEISRRGETGSMAGHSKFKNIMHRKGAQDKKRSAMVSKLSREITVAAKMGTPDPDMNPRLRAALLAAKAQSMPQENIQRASDKSSAGEGANYEDMPTERHGPGR